MSTEFDQTANDGDSMDQLQPSDSLIDRGVVDVLDEGIIAPDNWSPAQAYGTTAAEMRQGETLEMRLTQEEPDKEIPDPDEPWNPTGEKRQVGAKRAGRLVAPDSGSGVKTEAEAIAEDVGIDGGAASAEEAAVHVMTAAEDANLAPDIVPPPLDQEPEPKRKPRKPKAGADR